MVNLSARLTSKKTSRFSRKSQQRRTLVSSSPEYQKSRSDKSSVDKSSVDKSSVDKASVDKAASDDVALCIEQKCRTSLDRVLNLSDDHIDPLQLLENEPVLRRLTRLQQVDFAGTDFFEPDRLRKLGCLPSLKSLRLSGCRLTSAAFLAALPHVDFCDLSHNSIFDLGDLAFGHCPTLPSLRHLDLSWNTLPDTESLLVLAKVCPNLDRLDCRGCPFVSRSASLQSIARQVVLLLPRLKNFSGFELESSTSKAAVDDNSLWLNSPENTSREPNLSSPPEPQETSYFSFAPELMSPNVESLAVPSTDPREPSGTPPSSGTGVRSAKPAADSAQKPKISPRSRPREMSPSPLALFPRTVYVSPSPSESLSLQHDRLMGAQRDVSGRVDKLPQNHELTVSERVKPVSANERSREASQVDGAKVNPLYPGSSEHVNRTRLSAVLSSEEAARAERKTDKSTEPAVQGPSDLSSRTLVGGESSSGQHTSDSRSFETTQTLNGHVSTDLQSFDDSSSRTKPRSRADEKSGDRSRDRLEPMRYQNAQQVSQEASQEASPEASQGASQEASQGASREAGSGRSVRARASRRGKEQRAFAPLYDDTGELKVGRRDLGQSSSLPSTTQLLMDVTPAQSSRRRPKTAAEPASNGPASVELGFSTDVSPIKSSLEQWKLASLRSVPQRPLAPKRHLTERQVIDWRVSETRSDERRLSESRLSERRRRSTETETQRRESRQQESPCQTRDELPRSVSRMPRKDVVETSSSLALHTPATPVIAHSNGRQRETASRIGEPDKVKGELRKCESTPKSCSTRASVTLPGTPSILDRRPHTTTSIDDAGDSGTPGMLRNLRLPDTAEHTRIHPRRPLRDQPDASQIEAAAHASQQAPVSLIGVHLSQESLRLAESALYDDPYMRHRAVSPPLEPWLSNYVIDGSCPEPVHRFFSPDTLGELTAVWSELSSALVWTLQNKKELESEVDRISELFSKAETIVRDMLSKFQKMRQAFLASLRRLSVALKEPVLEAYGKALESRTDQLLRRLETSAASTQRLEAELPGKLASTLTGSTLTSMRYILRCALEASTSDPFICLVAALLFADFDADVAEDMIASTDDLSGTLQSSALATQTLMSFLDEKELAEETQTIRTLAAFEKELVAVLRSGEATEQAGAGRSSRDASPVPTGSQTTSPTGSPTGSSPAGEHGQPRDLALLSPSELCALALRLRASHHVAVARLLVLSSSAVSHKAQLSETEQLLEQVQLNIVEISEKLTAIASACPECIPADLPLDLIS